MENLLFFNKKGYPYNFTYNNDKWEGKLIFDENASDTFRTIGMYIFEKVEPIEYVSSSDFLKLTYYNNSGVTFNSKVDYENIEIENIEKINNSTLFYSKWIIGDELDRKFPKGTIVVFSGITGNTTYSSDFQSTKYFQVVDNRKDAIMIITETNNNTFDFTFSAGTISNSLNVISINDYNRGLSGETFFQNLYNDKKLSIINSTSNDNIIDIDKTGLTYTYLNDIKVTGSTNQDLTLRLHFLTERPKLYNGKITISRDNIGRYVCELNKLNSNFYIGTNFIVEDQIGNDLYSGYTFQVNSLIDTELLSNSKQVDFLKLSSKIESRKGKIPTIDYRLEFNGYLDIKRDDIITLSATTLTTQKNHNRNIKILDTHYYDGLMTLRSRGIVIPETGMTYSIIKNLKVKQQNKMYISSSGFLPYGYTKTENDSILFSTNNYLNFTQEVLRETGTTYYNTIQAFLSQHNSLLKNTYGINTYYTKKGTDGYLSVESLYGTYNKYIYATGYIESTLLTNDYSLSKSGLTERYNIITNKPISNERTWRYDENLLSKKSSASILMNLNYNTSNYGFKLTLNSNEYFVKYTGSTQTTINSFVSRWEDILYVNGFNIYSGYTSSGVNSGYTLNVIGLNADVNIWNLDVTVNLLSTYNITSEEQNQGLLLAGNEIRSTSIDYFDAGLSTGMIINISGSSFNDNNKEYNIIGLTEDKMQLSYQGSFFKDVDVPVLGKTRDFIRKPRGDYNKDIYFKVSWIPVDDREYPIDDTIFFYDISGTQLKPYVNSISGQPNELLRYTGTIPLISAVTNNVVYLNSTPNQRLDRINQPKYQQTVFDNLEYELEQLDSSESYNWVPEPLEFYIGYNSITEGVNSNIMKIEKIEKIQNTEILFNISGYTTPIDGDVNNFYFSGYTVTFENINFISVGFEVGQDVEFRFKDQALLNQQIFKNVEIYTIEDVGRNTITLNKSGYTFNTTGTTFHYKIEVQPKEISRFSIYGQTEIEDVRFKINLNNVGVQISDDTAKIFKESDIKDNAVDFRLLNRKRKEMLTTYREIYDYIGSYKGLVNAINYFGYTDLELYEYYINIDKNSKLYKKLQKVWIPDIFDNSVEGWNEIDFIAGKHQNKANWTKTNLFNLTYRITDEEGNNVLMYTLDEVQYKLNKLKGWLRRNVIPISANLLDITGVADTTHTLYQNYDESNQVKGSHVSRESTIVNFNYNATLNFGTDYLINVNFYVLSGETMVSETPNFFTAKIKTFYLSGTTMIPVQYHKLRKNDLNSYSFNIDKLVDPYIYIEVTSYDNSGNGLGIKNNKMFYFDEPRNHWLVNHNFDMKKYKYILNSDFIADQKETTPTSYKRYSTVINTSVETNINVDIEKKSVKPN